MGAAGVASAVSISAVFQVGLLFALWNARSGNTEGRSVYRFYLKIILISTLMGLFLEWVRNTGLSGIDTASAAGALVVCVILSLAFVALLLLVGYGLKIREVAEMIDRFVLRRRASQ